MGLLFDRYREAIKERQFLHEKTRQNGFKLQAIEKERAKCVHIWENEQNTLLCSECGKYYKDLIENKGVDIEVISSLAALTAKLKEQL